jgi:hypothetical protein
MSYDYNVLTVDPTSSTPVGACDHQISFERYVINQTDFRTLNYAGNYGSGIDMRAPINGANFVQMWISQEEVTSDDPTYGWQVVQDTDRIAVTNDIFYKIVFNHPVRIVLPLIEVSYITRQQYCLKCSALGALNDFKQSSTGFLQVVQNVKLAQKALKWILTSNCPFYPNFICQLKSYIGQKLGIQLTDTDIQTQVLNALTRMQQVQQAQSTVQSLDPAEILKDIVNVSANIDPNDPTTVRVTALCTSYTGSTTPLGFTLRVNS